MKFSILVLILVVGFFGCFWGSSGSRDILDPVCEGAGRVFGVLGERHDVGFLGWPRTGDEGWPGLDHFDLLVFDLRSRQLPAAAREASCRLSLRRWLAGGGRLLLLGYSPLWLAGLGLVKEGSVQPFYYRRGFTDRSVTGRFSWGIAVAAGGRAGSLFSGLRAEAGSPGRFLLGGGVALGVELAPIMKNAGGQQLAELFLQTEEGEMRSGSGLHAFSHGKGMVLALGTGLQPGVDDQAGRNCRQLLFNAIEYLGAKYAQPRIGRLAGVKPSPLRDEHFQGKEETKADRCWWRGDFPLAAPLSHWGERLRIKGWQGARGTMSKDDLLEQRIYPLHAAGGNLVEIDLWVAGKGYPFSWPANDPASGEPAGYQGSGLIHGWSDRSLAGLAKPLHERGMLAQAFLPMPVLYPVNGPDRAQDLRRVANLFFKQIFPLQLLGSDIAFDGLGLGLWPADGKGGISQLLHTYHPGAYLHTTVRHHRWLPLTTRTVNGQFGRVPGIEAGGLARGWRWDWPPPLYLSLAADCRRNLPEGADPDGILTGQGASPDWILAQVNDFVRARQGRDNLLVWLGKEKGRLSGVQEHFVNAVSGWPLDGAFACRLSATGRGGWREEAAKWQPQVQAGFGAMDERTCRRTFIQNGWFRLYGTGGALLYDPLGTARFPRKHEDVPAGAVLSGSFFRTEIKNSRFSSKELVNWFAERRNTLQTPFTSDNDQLDYVVVDLHPERVSPAPARLVPGKSVHWPGRMLVNAAAPPGNYRFRLRCIPLNGPGMIRLEQGGEPLAFKAFTGAEKEVAMDVPVAHPSMQTFRFQVIVESGNGIRLKEFSLKRVSDICQTSQIEEPGGPRAVVAERLHCAALQEKRRIITHASLPGLVIDVKTDKASAGLLVERHILFTGYERLVRGGQLFTSGARFGFNQKGHAVHEKAWVLEDQEGELPPVAFLPLRGTQNMRITWQPGFGLTIKDNPQAGQRFSLAFYFLNQQIGPENLGQLAFAFAQDVLRVPVIDLSQSPIVKVPCKWPFPWPKVFELGCRLATPLMVREKGWWVGSSGLPSVASGFRRTYLQVRLKPGVDGGVCIGGDGCYSPGTSPIQSRIRLPWVNNMIRPGRGCQRVVALQPIERGQRFNVAVLKDGPFIYAPSVRLRRKVTSATLDGQPWSYFGGKRIFLPCTKGQHTVTVEHTGMVKPHLEATAALIRKCTWNPALGLLKFDAFHPPLYTEAGPQDVVYHFLVRPAGWQVARVEGARLVEKARGKGSLSSAGLVLEGFPGRVKLWLEKN